MAAEQPKSAGSTPTTKSATATGAAAAPPLKSDRIPPPQATAQTPPIDGKSFYGYLIKKDRTPTELLDALLRAIAKHITAEIGDKKKQILDRTKLAAFYKIVGGDYDSLFVGAPDKSISYIWTALGVQHMLYPGDNDFAAPSIPALTPKGFARWESLQILLEPEEHVPYIQYAVRNWGLKHPDTGVPFPTDLPKEALPSKCDPYIDAWHRGCAEKLRHEAATPTPPPAAQDPRVHFTHVRGSHTASAKQATGNEYFERERAVPFTHIPGRRAHAGARQAQSPDHRRRVSTSSSSPDEPAVRRRSFSDYPPSSPEVVRPSPHIDPRRPIPLRRHSSTRDPSPTPSDSESGVELSPRVRPVPPGRPKHSVRVFPPEAPPPPPAVPGMRPHHRTELRPPEPRRRSLPGSSSPLGSIRQKLSSFLPGSSERPHSSSREKARPERHSSRLSRSYSDDSYASDSGSDVPPKMHNRRDRDRDRLRERDRERERDLERTIERQLEREHRERELEEERERRSRKDKSYMRRPVLDRRTSSAADIDRRSKEYGWEPRERDSRLRDRERGRDRAREEDLRRSSHSDDRDRKRYRDGERGSSPIVVGVGGRKYPPAER
ncbi:hypothetical protein PG996_005898 [Apiospora saccharicola]|uniref:DUF7514 domain-containing protein n=1 Tax=Apiospora saccharicola TaxID=335842 RepID=A0ABR1VMR1_9PEZI